MQIYLGKPSAVTGKAIVRLASTTSFSLLNKNLGTYMFLLLKMKTFLKFSPIHNLMYIFLRIFYLYTRKEKTGHFPLRWLTLTVNLTESRVTLERNIWGSLWGNL